MDFRAIWTRVILSLPKWWWARVVTSWVLFFISKKKKGYNNTNLQDFYSGVYEIIYVKCIVFKKIFIVHFLWLDHCRSLWIHMVNKRDVVPAPLWTQRIYSVNFVNITSISIPIQWGWKEVHRVQGMLFEVRG